MMKVLYLVSNLRSTGTTTQLFNLINNLNKNKKEIFILTLSKENKNSKIDEFKKICTVINLNVSRLNFWGATRKLNKIINDIEPHIIHSHTLRPDILNAFYKKSRYNTISTIHSHSGEFFYNTYGLLGMFFYKVHKYAMKNINVLVACSHSVQRYTENITNNNVKVIFNGTEIRNNIDDINILIEGRRSNKKKKIVYVGSLTHLKNVKFLIDSFLKFNVTNKYELILIGDGELSSYAKEFSEKGVKVLGEINNVNSFLQKADILISASKSEGLPMAVIEGMSYGLPVLLSDIPSHTEIFEINNDIGCIFKNNDYDDLIDKLYKTLNVEYSTKAMNSYLTSTENFNAIGMSLKYEKLYDEIY